MSERNFYAEAIAIITDDSTNFKKLLIEVAKFNPEVLVAAKEGQGWQAEVRAILKNGGGKIDAIKACRNASGLGLKEAKDAVETLMATEGL
jgi:ribosomal protein L7/L12